MVLIGPPDRLTLKLTSSSVDEGVPGKVKLLYDLEFEGPKDGNCAVGLLLEAYRGSSPGAGMLHGDTRASRRYT